MSLLEALVAFVSTAFVARPEKPNPIDVEGELSQARRQIAALAGEVAEVRGQRDAARREVGALRHERDVARHQHMALLVEVSALRHERDSIVAMYAGLAPRVGVQLAAQNAFGHQNAQIFAAQAQMQSAQASLGLLNALSQTGDCMLDRADWRPCTCVPGRYDALRQPRAGGLDGA